MKSKWLPTFPLHAAHWLADPRVQMLSKADRCELLEALLRSWMLGKAIVVTSRIAESYAELWPEYEAVKQEHEDAYERRRKQTDAARKARHGESVTTSVTEPVEPPEQSLSQTEPEPQPKPQPYPEPEPKPSSLRSEGARRQAPPDLELTQPRFEYALEQGLTIEAIGEEWEAFLDHRYRTPRTKWDLAWKAWVRKAVEIRGLGVSRRGPPQTAAGRTMSNVEEFLKQSGAL